MDPSGKTGLERTVVLKQKDGSYGFRLSKEGPVVTQVSAGSSAERAGVNPGDKLMKVNGVEVSSLKAVEVEGMIQEHSYITLTLHGKLAQNGTRGKDSGVEISAPRQMQELTLQTMRNMLQKQRRSYEALSVNYCKAPSEKLGKEIQDCESIIKLLESEIASKSPPIDAHVRMTAASIEALRSRPGQSALRRSGDDMDLNSSRKNPVASSSISPPKGPVKGGSVKHPSRAATFHNGSISPSKRRHHVLGFLGGGSSGHIVDSSDLSDDDDLSDAVDGASEAGPFSSLQELRNNPAHMSVFIHYLSTNKNPNALLFYLVSLSYQNHCKTADLRQRGADIFWTFFTEQAPLPIDIDSTIVSRSQHTLEVEENENHLRSVFVEPRETLSEHIIADLADYRHKRVMGLAGMFGDHMLTNNMSISRQTEVVMTLLIPQVKAKNDDANCATVLEATKSHAIAACLATFVLDSCSKSGIAKATPPLDKTQTFTRADVVLRKGRGGKKKTTITKHGHVLHLESYGRPAFCDLCSKQLWGIIYQGYQCSECKMNIHRYYCLGQLEQPCLGKNPGFMSTSRRRRTSQHSIKKIHLSTILTGGQPPPSEDIDAEPTRLDAEGGRKSPLLEPGSLDREGELMKEMDGGEDQTGATKPRSTSDPKHMMLVQSASVVPGEPPEQYSSRKESLKVSRTQSAKYDSREDHMAAKHISEAHNLTMSSSDDSLIGAKLESIVEGGTVIDEEIKELLDNDIEEEPLPWALSVKREVVQSLHPYEVQRQEYIKELVYTERTHLHKLKTMKFVYKIPMIRESVLPAEQVEQLFSGLEELILFHSGLCAELKEHTAETTNGVVKTIANVLLQRFDGAAGEKLCHACSISASNQVNADHLIKDWRRKNEKFKTFIRSAEQHLVCRRHRLTLTELMPITWQRLTKYQLLVKSILSSYKKHWEELSDVDKEEAQKVETTLTCVKGILQYVNKQLNLAQNRQRLLEYQSKLDVSALERTTHPIAQQFKALDLGAERRRLLHEGPLTWKIQGRKVIELYALLLTDILVLVERHEERDKFYLRCYTVEGLGGMKEELSPVIRLKDCLLRSAAADKGGRTFLIVNNSSLMKLAQMYEFTTDSPREKRQWEEAISRAMQGTQDILEPPISPGTSDLHSVPFTATHVSSQDVIREQLNKIDEDIKKQLNEKLRILRSMQGTLASPRHTLETKAAHEEEGDTLRDPKFYVSVAIEQAGEMASTLSHVMVTNPTKNILAETQSRLADIISEAQRNFSRLILSLDQSSGGPPESTEDSRQENGRVEDRELAEDGNENGELHTLGLKREEEEEEEEEANEVLQRRSSAVGSSNGSPEGEGRICAEDDIGRSGGGLTGAHHPCMSPESLPPADLVSLTSQEGVSIARGDEELIAPPETFGCDDSATATPTPQPETESMASGTITPRTSPCEGTNTPLSPLSPKPHPLKDSTPPAEDMKEAQLYVPESPAMAQDDTTTSGMERVMTLTGGPSPRLMRIIASSYKSRDSLSGSVEPHVKPERTLPRHTTGSSDEHSSQPAAQTGSQHVDI